MMGEESEAKLPGQSVWSIFWFSLPAIFGSLVEPIAGFIDTALVGQLSTKWLAALALGTTIFNSFSWVFNFLFHVTVQNISSSFEASGPENLAKKIWPIFCYALGIGLISSVCLYLSRISLYHLIGADEVLIGDLDQYFGIRVMFHFLGLLYISGLSMIRGLGEVRASLWLVLGITMLNAALSWFFLYQLNWGIAGVAYGTIISSGIGFISSLVFLNTRVPLLRGLAGLVEQIKSSGVHFGKQSGALFVRSCFLTGSFFLSSRLAMEMGVTQVAAHQVLLQYWLISSFFTDGVALTANICLARAQYQTDLALFQGFYRNILKLGIIIGIGIAGTYLLLTTPLIRLLTDDENVVMQVRDIWPYLVVFQIPNSLAFVFDGIYFGLGKFWFLAKLLMLVTIFLFLPLAIYGQYANQLVFIWLGLGMLNIGRLGLSYLELNRFKRQRWSEAR